MKVVLRQDVKSIGKKDELHEVSDGYARNFLFPRGLAVQADSAAMQEVKSKQNAREHHHQEEVKAAQKLAGKLDGTKLTIKAKVGENGHLFGAVTARDVSKALKDSGFDIDKRKINLGVKDIKSFGEYDAEIKIMAGITANVLVIVEG